MAADAVRAGSARRVLVVATERLTDWVDADDRVDGRSFSATGPAPHSSACRTTRRRGRASGPGVGHRTPVAWGHRGADSPVIEIRDEFMQMQGCAVFRWATTQLVPVARRACELAGDRAGGPRRRRPAPGQPAHPRVDGRSLGATNAVLARDIVDNGNSSAASVPLALARLVDVRRGRKRRPGAAVRLRRRAHLRRPGRPASLTRSPATDQHSPIKEEYP